MTAQDLISNNHNIVNLTNNSLPNVIDVYLKKQKKNSENTYKNYIRYFEEFFRYMFNKSITEITWDDITNDNKLNRTQVTKYQLEFSEIHANSYVNNKLSAVRKLFEYLARENENITINIKAFDIEDLNEHKDSYDPFTEEEIENLIEFAKGEYHGDIQSLAFRTFYNTGLRREPVLSLEWNQIKKVLDHDSHQMVWCIVTTIKRDKEVTVPISEDFYNELCVLKKYNNDRVFKIDVRALYKTIDRFCEEYGIDTNERNLKIHSIRKTAGMRVYQMYGIKAAQEFLHHNHISTTGDVYLNNNCALTSKPSFLMGKEIDLSVLRGLGEDGLIELISKCSIVVQNEIVQKVKGSK